MLSLLGFQRQRHCSSTQIKRHVNLEPVEVAGGLGGGEGGIGCYGRKRTKKDDAGLCALWRSPSSGLTS